MHEAELPAWATPDSLRDALAAIYPDFLDEWEPDEAPETLHGVMLRFTPFFGTHSVSSTPAELARLGDLDFPTNGEHRVNGYPARSYSMGDR